MVNLVKFYSTMFYPLLPPILKRKIRDKKALKMLRFARENSNFYKDFYKDTEVNSIDDFKNLPVLNKEILMENFDKIVTDKNVTLESVENYISDLSNIGKDYLDKYKVMTTSGTTFKPIVFLADRRYINAFFCDFALRSRTRYFPYTALATDNGFYCGNIMSRNGFNSSLFYFFDSMRSTNEIVDFLNKHKPRQLLVYPSTLLILANEQLSGRLHIHPKRICTSAENLTSELRTYFKKVFKCNIYSVYTSTETGHIGSDCRCGRMHFWEDNIYIEAVDKDNQPVADGELSDKILITNLNNRVMPLIRYEINDRVVIHREKCDCLSITPWLEIIGRSAVPVLTFKRETGDIAVSFNLIELGIDYLTVASVQAIQHGQYKLEIRISFFDNIDIDGKITRFKRQFEKLFAEQGLPDIEITVLNAPPIRDSKSSKAKKLIVLDN